MTDNMTTQTANAMPYHQSANGVGYDALKVSELIGKPLPENKPSKNSVPACHSMSNTTKLY
ncbi:hypothetical protein [Rothia terrae]|uniref:Uncharacterized protein n=1 Tax=Rothia terrae TaxID=396015 RepID=A0A7H2BD01_9MICC|nr:hypothetical protein [Rothia terrae]QNV37547.1 hypothetical protein IDM49_10085 [Rothia terrae]